VLTAAACSQVPVDAVKLPLDDGAANGAAPGRPDPLFVLCMGRSGSTLLRFLLDAHPDLACPPETNLPALCGQLAVVWSLIEGAPLSAERGDAPPRVPDAAIAGIRRMADEMTGSYLARRGKRQFCDKSLGSARFADLLVRIYPGAKFLCLYRHPMDVIRSGLDACPWGLNGYGFEQYSVGSPGNAVLALARYWLDNATPIAAVEEAHPARCHRVRYEDLVQNPEQVTQEIYAFIGVRPAPGVAQACFSRDRERFGPADHKIWATSTINGDSVGRGESVPAGLIPPPIAAGINDLADKLGYLRIDEDWGTPGRPADPRLPATIKSPPPPGSLAGGPVAESGVLAERLRARLEGTDEQFTRRWESCAAEKFLIVSRTAVAGGSEVRWLVDIAARTATADDGQADDADWNILGAPEAWQAVVAGQDNLHAALRRCDLRYCSPDEDSPLITQTRISMLADLLGLSSWGQADVARQNTAGRSAAAAPG
jgi:protein-tyrosine sulfotransferase